jgi:sn-1 stearoyl-lipid 9-desaturase
MVKDAYSRQQRTAINWPTTITMVIFHIGAIAALLTFNWSALIVSILMWWIAGSLGVGMGYHRLLTHRGYKTSKIVEYFLTLCGTLALEGGPIAWVATHRLHHKYTDDEGDPHTPRDGKWWAHMGWILTGTAQQHDEKVLMQYAPDLMKDKFHVWLNRWYFLPLVLFGVGIFIVGGWTMLLWSVFLRVTFGLHTTWMVNSATHKWGSRRFQTKDDYTNNWLVALLTFGEGWHNNHHAHPTAARHGLAWYELDINWWGIRLLERVGLAKAIKKVGLSNLAFTDGNKLGKPIQRWESGTITTMKIIPLGACNLRCNLTRRLR